MHHVALLRGINVGGGNKLPMADLRAMAQDLGWMQVRTYIASGNLVFEAEGKPDDLASRLKGLIHNRLGLSIPVLVLPRRAMNAALADCPFDPDEPRHVHVAFGLEDFDVDQEKLAGLIAPDENFQITGRTAYLYAPSGIGRSKLAGSLDRVLGVPATARNLRTVATLVEMLDG